MAAFHTVAWLLVVLPAVLFVPGPVRHNAGIYALRLCLPLMLCAVFYANYLVLVPHWFIRRRFKAYACANIVMLALLSLGFKNIRLGPTLPAFLSPGIAKVLSEAFGIRGITDPATDVEAMMSGK